MRNLISHNWFSILMLGLWLIIAIRQCSFTPDPVKSTTTEFIDVELKRLEARNKTLQNKITLLEAKLDRSQTKIDSLTNLKQKIKYVYIDKIHSVDTMGFGSLLHEFRIILTKPNQK